MFGLNRAQCRTIKYFQQSLYLNNVTDYKYKMKSISILALVVAILAHSGMALIQVGQGSCELCMQTYKTNCTICFEHCNAPNTFVNCTSHECTSKDADGNCLTWSSTARNTNTCLGSCCASFSPNETYTEYSFNLCVERDAAMNDDINIGLTLGLVLSLLGLLFLAGLACLLIMIFCDDTAQVAKAGSIPPSAEAINTIRYNTNRKDVDDAWTTDGTQLRGNCTICSRGRPSFVGACGHQFHYGCLSRNINVVGEQRCPMCSQPGSMSRGKMYCSACLKNYKVFNSQHEKIEATSIAAIESMKCPSCE